MISDVKRYDRIFPIIKPFTNFTHYKIQIAPPENTYKKS